MHEVLRVLAAGRTRAAIESNMITKPLPPRAGYKSS